MTFDQAEGSAARPNGSVTQWLLDADPSIRWQVMRDLLGATEKEVAAERARVATEGVVREELTLLTTLRPDDGDLRHVPKNPSRKASSAMLAAASTWCKGRSARG